MWFIYSAMGADAHNNSDARKLQLEFVLDTLGINSLTGQSSLLFVLFSFNYITPIDYCLGELYQNSICRFHRGHIGATTKIIT